MTLVIEHEPQGTDRNRPPHRRLQANNVELKSGSKRDVVGIIEHRHRSLQRWKGHRIAVAGGIASNISRSPYDKLETGELPVFGLETAQLSVKVHLQPFFWIVVF